MPDYKLVLYEIVGETEVIIKDAKGPMEAKKVAGDIPKDKLKFVSSKYKYVCMDAEVVH